MLVDSVTGVLFFIYKYKKCCPSYSLKGLNTLPLIPLNLVRHGLQTHMCFACPTYSITTSGTEEAPLLQRNYTVMRGGVFFSLPPSFPPHSPLPWLQSTVKLIRRFIPTARSPGRGCTHSMWSALGKRGLGEEQRVGQIKGSKVKSSKIMRLFRPASTAAKEQSALSNWVSQLHGWNNWSQKAASKLPWQGCYCCKSSKVLDTRSAAANQVDRKSCSLSLWFLPRPQLSLTIPVPQRLLWLNQPPFYISFRVRFTH